METVVEGAGERYEGLRDRLFEEVESWMSGGGEKGGTTVRVVNLAFSSAYSPLNYPSSSVKVEECKV